jgi:hypothetical protein
VATPKVQASGNVKFGGTGKATWASIKNCFISYWQTSLSHCKLTYSWYGEYPGKPSLVHPHTLSPSLKGAPRGETASLPALTTIPPASQPGTTGQLSTNRPIFIMKVSLGSQRHSVSSITRATYTGLIAVKMDFIRICPSPGSGMLRSLETSSSAPWLGQITPFMMISSIETLALQVKRIPKEVKG